MKYSIEIKGADELAAKIRNLPGQIAFANSKAVNDIAVAVQEFEISAQFPRKITLRSRGTPWTKPGTKFGLNIKPFATKARPSATIGTQADWLRLQESGGTKRASGHRIAIATSFWRSDKEIMAKSKKPRTLLNANRRRSELAGRAFIYEGDKMPHGIFARNKRKSRALRMLFRFVDSAAIRPVLEFTSSATAVILKVYPDMFHKRLSEALRTARLQ